MGKFSGFNLGDFGFISELEANNNTSWFNRHRERWDSLREKLRGLCVELAPFISELDPKLETTPKTSRCLGRINRDTRFSSDKRPYKGYIDILFFPRDFGRTTAPGFAVGLSREHTYIGTWLGVGMKSFRERFEINISAHRDTFNNYLEANGNFSDMKLDGEIYVRPRIEGLHEPAFGWAQLKYFYLGLLTPPAEAERLGLDFVSLVEKTFIRLYPLFLFATSLSLPFELEQFHQKFE